MTKLLISVRSAAEGRAALDGGADVIDLKEPSRGALGRTDAGIWREVVRETARRARISVALGELIDDEPLPAAPGFAGISFAKIGLANGLSRPDWRSAWRRRLDELPSHVASVAVAYVDAPAGAPDHHLILETGATLGCRGLLLDTFDKSRGGLFDHLDEPAIQELIARAHRLNVWVALAGSLGERHVPRALTLRPDIIAVRGAACQGGREGTVVVEHVQRLRALIGPGDSMPLSSTEHWINEDFTVQKERIR